jgi:hypothetical protein
MPASGKSRALSAFAAKSSHLLETGIGLRYIQKVIGQEISGWRDMRTRASVISVVIHSPLDRIEFSADVPHVIWRYVN